MTQTVRNLLIALMRVMTMLLACLVACSGIIIYIVQSVPILSMIIIDTALSTTISEGLRVLILIIGLMTIFVKRLKDFQVVAFVSYMVAFLSEVVATHLTKWRPLEWLYVVVLLCVSYWLTLHAVVFVNSLYLSYCSIDRAKRGVPLTGSVSKGHGDDLPREN